MYRVSLTLQELYISFALMHCLVLAHTRLPRWELVEKDNEVE